jgi:hypothetical protein
VITTRSPLVSGFWIPRSAAVFVKDPTAVVVPEAVTQTR